MKNNTYDSILKHYSELYKKFGDDPASLGWPKGKQYIRFQIMSEIGNIKNSKILDVGCGFGDFAKFLARNKIDVDYTGIDINPTFIEIAKKKNPGKKFQVRDIERNRFRQKFDWIVAIGTTNKAGSYQYIENLLTEMFKIARKGIAMDFLSSYVDFKGPGDYHASPERIFKIAKKLSKRVVIRHDYLPWQFSVYIYTNDKLNKDNLYQDYNL